MKQGCEECVVVAGPTRRRRWARVVRFWRKRRAESLLTTNGKFFAWPDTEVPGVPGVYFGGNVDFSTLAENGTLAFRADLYGAGTSAINSRALFTGASAATLSMLARWNDPAPGLPGLSLMNSTGTQGIAIPDLDQPVRRLHDLVELAQRPGRHHDQRHRRFSAALPAATP